MKKFLLEILTFVLFIPFAVSAEEIINENRIVSPEAAVYTHWGDSEQTDQKFNYNWVLKSSAGIPSETTENDYWEKPERALYYKFDISTYINEGYTVESAVILQNGPASQEIRLIDCPENTLENGQNYLTVPQHLRVGFSVFNCETANVGTEGIKNKYPGARSTDNCEFDITDYVTEKLSEGKQSFTFMMYPKYGQTTIYMLNHAQLYLKLSKQIDNTLYLHCGNGLRLSISGRTQSPSVNINVTDNAGTVCHSVNIELAEGETSYRCSFNMDNMTEGDYSVTAEFNNGTLEKEFHYKPLVGKNGTIFLSVDYDTETVRIYGRAGQGSENVMLTVLNQGFTAEALSDEAAVQEAICHTDMQNTDDGFYSFCFKMKNGAGTYPVIVRSAGVTIESFFAYNPGGQSELGRNIDLHTTTYYAPWMINWHLTKQNQIENGYLGGEAGQMSWSMAYSPINPDIMLAGTDTNALWRSEDGGASWRISSAGFGIMGTADIAFDPENENTVYALGSTGSTNVSTPYAGIYKSIDGGVTWRQIYQNTYYRVKSNKIIQFSSRGSDGKRRIFVGGHGTDKGSVYSDDEGETWKTLGDVFSDKCVIDLYSYDSMLAVATDNGVFVSFDNGDTFEERSVTQGVGGTLAVDPNDIGHWVIGIDTEIYETVNYGTSWSKINTVEKKISALRYGIGAAPRLYIQLSLIQYPLRYSTDNGRSFITPVKADNSAEFMEDNSGWGGEPFISHPTNPDILFASFDGELYKTEDGGDTWFASSSGYSGIRAADFLFDEDDENSVYIASIDRGIIKTAYSGHGEEYPAVDYSSSEDSTGIRYMGNKSVQAVARDPKDKNRILINIGGSGKYIIKQSYNDGKTYSVIEGTENQGIKLIEFNRDNPNTIYAGNIVSYDNGESWQNSTVSVMAVSPFDESTVYGIMGKCAARSSDEGRTWESFSVPLDSTNQMFADLFDEGVLYLSCFDRKMTKVYPDGNIEIITPGTRPFENGDKFICLTTAQDPRNPKHIVSGGTDNKTFGFSGGIYESYDGGKNWNCVKGMPGSKDIWKIEFHPTLPRIYVATSSGTFIYEYEKYSEDTVVVTEQKGSVSGDVQTDFGSINSSMTLWNTGDKPINAVIFGAIYKDGSLTDADIRECGIQPYGSAALTTENTVSAGLVVKTFVWDKNMSPLNPRYGWNYIEKEVSAE